MKKQYSIPILLIIFKRKNYLKKILNEIKKINPLIVYIFQDGPRDLLEKKDLEEVYNFVISFLSKNKINYKFNKEKNNLGVALAEKKAIDWVFKKEKYLVFIEDDNLINQDFFLFMEKVLKKYEDEEKIIAVNGINFYSNLFKNLKISFYLSRFFIAWGFGLWRRSWKLYDFYLKDFKLIKKQKDYLNRFLNKRHRFYLESYFKPIYEGKFKTTWDLQLTYLAYKYDKYFITPKNNFCINLGQDLGGTNPFLWKDINKLEKLESKIIYPKKLIYNKKFDEIYFKNRLRGGWFRLIGIYIYNNLMSEKMKYYFVKILRFFLRK